MEPTTQAPPPDDDQDPVPIFGSWRKIYAAVIVTTLAWIALSAAFTHWSF